MLEIIILTVIIVVAFIATSWYTHQRSQERAKAFERELDETRDDESFQQRFDALFEEKKQLVEEAALPPDTERLTDTPEIEPDLFDEPRTAPSKGEAQPEEQTPQTSEADWEMVVAFTIMAGTGTMFSGRAVKAALDQHDLHFGDMQIYHKYHPGSAKQTLYSVANILDPGTLLPDKFVSMKTPGLLLFARLPGPVNGLALFDDLLDTARSITDRLGGELCDETRRPITDDALEQMRGRILNYQMSAQTEDNAQSNDYYN